MPRFDGKCAVVTGAESGIGAAIATTLGSLGAHVIVDSFAQPDGAKETVEKIIAAGGRGEIVHADVSKEEDVDRLFAAAERACGRADVLASVAGINTRGHIVDMSYDEWRRTLDVNLNPAFLCSRRYLRTLKSSGMRGGSIVCISSVHQDMPALGVSAYCASKGGLHMFVKCLAMEAAQFGVTANLIAPGTILTAMTQELLDDPEALEEHERTIPIGRAGVPNDIAKSAAFLLSEDASYITGTTLVVDGGMLLNVGSGEPQEG